MELTPIAQAAHALFSASGAEGWMLCAPKLAAEQGKPDSASQYAAEGTAAHELASDCLEHFVKTGERQPAAAHLGRVIETDGFTFTVDEDMAGHVQTYVDAIHDRIDQFKLRGAVSVQLLVEVRVDYSRYIDQPNSFGTSDVVLLVEWANDVWQIDVGDLKYGMGVQVFASTTRRSTAGNWDVTEGNKQMMLYALGALDQFGMVCDATLFSMTIYQPRIRHIDSYECDLVELQAFAAEAKPAAARAATFIKIATDRGVGAFATTDYTPGEKQCRWCRVGGTCRARAEKNLATLAGDFDNLDATVDLAQGPDQTVIATVVKDAAGTVKLAEVQLLDALYPSLDEIDNWVKAVRGEIEKRALAGAKFSTCKLVTGKKGARAWTDEAEAEKLMKGMRLKVDQMYTFKLISPTTADKLLADQPKRWNKLKSFVGQAEGKLSVASIDDKRPAVVVTPPADDFDELDQMAAQGAEAAATVGQMAVEIVAQGKIDESVSDLV